MTRDGATTSRGSKTPGDGGAPSPIALFVAGGVLTALLAALTILITVLAQRPVGVPAEIALTAWILLGLSALLVLLTLVAWISRVMDGKASRGALNLRSGSISAVIALLLLLFAFSSIYLYSQVSAGESQGLTSTGISASTLASFSTERVLSINVAEEGASDGTGRTYDVVLAPSADASTDFAKTLIATWSTVVVDSRCRRRRRRLLLRAEGHNVVGAGDPGGAD